MNIISSSRFDEYDNETANIKITIDPVLGFSIEGYTNIHYVDPYDGKEKNESYDYNYHFDTEEFRALADFMKVDYPSYFSEQATDADSLDGKISLIIKEEFDFSADSPGVLHEYADSHHIQHEFTIR